MPENGVVQIPHEEILTYDEITRISRCMTGLGIRKIKLTGGEPLIRKNCATHRKSDINDQWCIARRTDSRSGRSGA